MSKVKTSFFCQSCGSQHTQWQGQCNSCKKWNTLTEEVVNLLNHGFLGTHAPTDAGGTGWKANTFEAIWAGRRFCNGEYFLVFLKPMIHPFPVKCAVILKVYRRHFIVRCLIRPDGIYRLPIPRLYGPVGGMPLVLAIALVTSRLH